MVIFIRFRIFGDEIVMHLETCCLLTPLLLHGLQLLEAKNKQIRYLFDKQKMSENIAFRYHESA